MEISFGNLLHISHLSQTDFGQIRPVVWLNYANTVSVVMETCCVSSFFFF